MDSIGEFLRWLDEEIVRLTRAAEEAIVRQGGLSPDVYGCVAETVYRWALIFCPDLDMSHPPRIDFLASDESANINLRRVCTRWLRQLQTSLVSGQTASELPVEYHVTLRQMAAIVSKSKKSMERLRDNEILPAPDVKGGKGKADEWQWSKVRPILEQEYKRELPEVFPADRFVR